jgi:hypothetical protein
VKYGQTLRESAESHVATGCCTNLPGSDIASRTVADADACALWCVTDPRCRSFSFSVPLPGRARPNTCWIKDSVPEPESTEDYHSGIVE